MLYNVRLLERQERLDMGSYISNPRVYMCYNICNIINQRTNARLIKIKLKILASTEKEKTKKSNIVIKSRNV